MTRIEWFAPVAIFLMGFLGIYILLASTPNIIQRVPTGFSIKLQGVVVLIVASVLGLGIAASVPEYARRYRASRLPLSARQMFI